MDKGESLPGKRNAHVSIGKEETLMLLRVYQCHPSAWGDIIDEMRENASQLPAAVRQLYESCSHKQLRDRLSLKLRKLMSQKAPIEDVQIREEICQIHAIEARHSGMGGQHQMAKELPPQTQSYSPRRSHTSTSSGTQNPVASTSRNGMKRTRDAIMTGLSSDEDDAKRKPKSQKLKPKKKPLMDLIRENQEKYNKFLTKKIPKLLTALGVESSESDD